jgi:hypothetical protein
MVTRKQWTIETVTALLHTPPLLFLLGVMAVPVGLAIILGHNVWSGGAVPIVVTLIGWSTLAKGLLFLFLSPEAASGLFLGSLHYEQLFYVYAAFSMLLGIYLTAASMSPAASA